MIWFVAAGIIFSVYARAENYEVGSVVAAEESKIETEVLAKTSNSWNGAVLPEYAAGQSEVTILRIKIPPGGKVAAAHSSRYKRGGIAERGAYGNYR